jgi:hypothetical protein
MGSEASSIVTVRSFISKLLHLLCWRRWQYFQLVKIWRGAAAVPAWGGDGLVDVDTSSFSDCHIVRYNQTVCSRLSQRHERQEFNQGSSTGCEEFFETQMGKEVDVTCEWSRPLAVGSHESRDVLGIEKEGVTCQASIFRRSLRSGSLVSEKSRHLVLAGVHCNVSCRRTDGRGGAVCQPSPSIKFCNSGKFANSGAMSRPVTFTFFAKAFPIGTFRYPITRSPQYSRAKDLVTPRDVDAW